MSAAEVLDLLRTRGIHLEPRGDNLTVYAEDEPEPATYDPIRAHKPALFALLEPTRDATPSPARAAKG